MDETIPTDDFRIEPLDDRDEDEPDFRIEPILSCSNIGWSEDDPAAVDEEVEATFDRRTENYL